MAQIVYQILSGKPNFTAHLIPSGIAPDQVQTELGEYTFDNVPNGYYVVVITDANGCQGVMECSTGVTINHSVRFNNYVCKQVEVTTTTTTPAPTTTTTTSTTLPVSTTTTTECVRPQGLIDLTLYRYITIGGIATVFTSTLELATKACYDKSNTTGSSIGGNINQTTSFEVGSRVYYGHQTRCIDMPDGYYLGSTPHQIIHIVNSYITEILDGCGYPTTTTTTTTVPTTTTTTTVPVTTTTTTIPALSTVFVPNAFSPNGDGIHDTFDIFNLQYYPNNEMWIFYAKNGATIYHTTNYNAAPWNGGVNNVLANKVPVGTYYYVLKINKKTYKKSFVFVSY
jgi:gliding motility-associated-like protein